MTKQRPMQLATLALLVAGLNASPLLAQGKTFKVGVPLPLTGAEAKFGEMEKQAYEMAVDEINAKGGVKGMKLALDIQDSGGKPETATAIVEKFITIDKYPIVVGEYTSQCSYAVAGVAEKYKVPYLVVTGAADKITQQGWKYVYRLNPPSSLYNMGIFSFFEQVAKPKSIAILYENTDFGTTTSKAMKEYADAKGIQVVLYEGYSCGSGRLQADPPEGQVATSRHHLHGVVPDGRLDAHAAEQGARHQPAGVHRRRRRLHAPRVPPERRGRLRVRACRARSGRPQAKYPGAKEFFDNFKKRFDKEPDYHGVEAYAAAYVLADTLKRAKSWTPDDLRDALGETNMMTAFGPGEVRLLGPVHEPEQDGHARPAGRQKKKFETVWPTEGASAKYVYPVPRWRDRK